MTDALLDDLLAPTEPPKRGRGRPTTAETLAKVEAAASQSPTGKIELPDVSMFFAPVGVSFLASILRRERQFVMRRLARCPVVDYVMHKGKQVPRYDFAEAIKYLVEPKIDIGQWIRAQNSATLPPHINKAFWDAENARQRWEVRAGQLWHHDDVLEVFGEVAMAMKESMQLWIENLPGKDQMTTEQYQALRSNVTALQHDIHDRLAEIPKKRATPSSVKALESVLDGQDQRALQGDEPSLWDDDE